MRKMRMAGSRTMEADDPISILIVDDSPTNLLALETILQAPDRNLVRAESGDDALRFLLDHEVAVSQDVQIAFPN